MRSMTNFIESRDIGDSYSIYNEEYSWAEEYSEYYSEDSSSYLMPVFESSSYQFFGEATFYQEASYKGLMAGGILALVSGALFMIMKLLNGGGGGSSGSRSSSSGSSSSSSGSSSYDSAGPRTPSATRLRAAAEDALYEKKKKQIEQEEQARAKQREKERKEREQRQKEEDAKSEQERLANAESEYRRSDEYLRFGKDEAEISFDPEWIIGKLNEAKSENCGKFKLKGGLKRLNNMQETLEDIERIVDTLNAMITDNNWEVFSHSSIENTDKMEDGDTKTFIISYRNLKDNFTKLRELIKGKEDNVEELEIDDIIKFFRSIKQITDEINRKCKSGIKKCKEEHRRLTSNKANLIGRGEYVDDVNRKIVNVKAAYNILNNILKEVNEFCKELRNLFQFVDKADQYTNYLEIPFIKDVYSNSNQFTFRMLNDMEVADFEDVIKGLINLQRKKTPIDYERLIEGLRNMMNPIETDLTQHLLEGSNGGGSAGFSELVTDVDLLRKECLDKIRKQKRIAEKIKNDYPEIKDYFLKALGILEDFYNVPGEEWVKVKSINERQEGKKLVDDFDDITQGPNQYNVAKKTVERYFQKKK